MNKGAAELSLSRGEERAYELLFDVHVLVEQLAENLLVDIATQPHHRELEEAGHGRREHVAGLATMLHIDQDRPAGELVEDVAGLQQIELENLACSGCSERLDRQLCNDGGLPLAEEDCEYLIQRV